MKPPASSRRSEATPSPASANIDARIGSLGDWRGERLARARAAKLSTEARR
jgi:hypothetical protein